MNKIILFIILFFSVLRIGYGEEHVEVSITADKCSLVEGDELLITYCITNKSLINYSFSKLSNQRLNSLYFFNKDALLKEFSGGIYELKYVPDTEDVYTLKPNETKCFNFKFKYSRRQLLINKKLLDRYLSNEEYDLYIDLQEENEFTIKGRYSLLDEETQFLEELIPSSIPFVGEVDSKNEIKVILDN